MGIFSRFFSKSATPYDFSSTLRIRIQNLHTLKKTLAKLVDSNDFVPILDNSADEPHEKLAELLRAYARTVDSSDTENKLLSSADLISKIGAHFTEFNRTAKVQIVDQLRRWCNHRAGGYQQAKRELKGAEEARDELNKAVKRSNSNESDVQRLKEDYLQKVRQLERHLENCYNQQEYALGAAIMRLLTLVRDFGMRCSGEQ